MQLSKDFIAGFASAISTLGREGDNRCVDWSAPYEYLKGRLATFEPEKPKELLGFKIVVSNAVAKDAIEFHHDDGRVDVFKIPPR